MAYGTLLASRAPFPVDVPLAATALWLLESPPLRDAELTQRSEAESHQDVRGGHHVLGVHHDAAVNDRFCGQPGHGGAAHVLDADYLDGRPLQGRAVLLLESFEATWP